jgi:hypothetical protein
MTMAKALGRYSNVCKKANISVEIKNEELKKYYMCVLLNQSLNEC